MNDEPPADAVEAPRQQAASGIMSLLCEGNEAIIASC